MSATPRLLSTPVGWRSAVTDVIEHELPFLSRPTGPGAPPGSHPRRWAASRTAEPPLSPDQDGGRGRRAARRAARGRGRWVPRPPPAEGPPHPVASGPCGPGCRQPRERGACPVVECQLHSGPFRRHQHHPVVFHVLARDVSQGLHPERARTRHIRDARHNGTDSRHAPTLADSSEPRPPTTPPKGEANVAWYGTSCGRAAPSCRTKASSLPYGAACGSASPSPARAGPGDLRPRGTPHRNTAPSPCLPRPHGGWAPTGASLAPMPGPTAEWSHLDTQPFPNDCATP
jgi:hypothetical protein